MSLGEAEIVDKGPTGCEMAELGETIELGNAGESCRKAGRRD